MKTIIIFALFLLHLLAQSNLPNNKHSHLSTIPTLNRTPYQSTSSDDALINSDTQISNANTNYLKPQPTQTVNKSNEPANTHHIVSIATQRNINTNANSPIIQKTNTIPLNQGENISKGKAIQSPPEKTNITQKFPEKTNQSIKQNENKPIKQLRTQQAVETINKNDKSSISEPTNKEAYLINNSQKVEKVPEKSLNKQIQGQNVQGQSGVNTKAIYGTEYPNLKQLRSWNVQHPVQEVNHSP